MALLALQRGENNPQALTGALMNAEFQATMILWARAWIRAHTPKKK